MQSIHLAVNCSYRRVFTILSPPPSRTKSVHALLSAQGTGLDYISSLCEMAEDAGELKIIWWELDGSAGENQEVIKRLKEEQTVSEHDCLPACELINRDSLVLAPLEDLQSLIRK